MQILASDSKNQVYTPLWPSLLRPFSCVFHGATLSFFLARLGSCQAERASTFDGDAPLLTCEIRGAT